MSNVYKSLFIATAILLLLALFFSTFVVIDSNRKQQTIESYKDSLHACQNAPIRIDTIRITTTAVLGDTLRPKPKPKPKPNPVVIADTVYVIDSVDCNVLEDSFYDERYQKITGTDTIALTWSAHVWGEIDWITFKDITYPRIIVDRIKTVTIASSPTHIPTSHWGLYMDVFGSNFKQMPGVGAGVRYTYKDKWGIHGGADYNTMVGSAYARIGIDIIF